jgi:hypothetical protein
MSTERLLRRVPTIARVLLSEYRDQLGEANITWLAHRLEHNDWEIRDAVRLREIMPAAALWLLTVGGDE